ncbi:MAG TPA: sulfite exporter TauE/SafE family protein [Pyrinomonadaceae bacterium]|nr:sulfite exporter TauE/SafE family protein [Pyrinomonadaceae bacterium]
MSAWEFYLIFTLGLVSSLHCVQMCGPLVLSYSLPLGARKFSQQIFAHLSYNAGRIITYALLGIVAGLFGGTVGFLGQLAGYENVAAIVAGVLMVIAGIIMLDLIPIKKLQKFNPLIYTQKFLRPLGRRISSTTIGSKFSLGLILGFMPCGLIYAALFKAMATGTMLAGAMTMIAFGLGTAGSLLAIGIFSSAFSLKLSRWGNKLAAVSVLLLGLFLVTRGIMPMMASAQNNSTQDSEVPACHRH